MAVTLAQAQQNAPDDVDAAIIQEYRRDDYLANALTFDDVVSPLGGGTLTYNYRRQITSRTAAFRKVNSEYVPQEVTTGRFSADLKPLGGSYQIDRVVANLGPAATGQIALQASEVLYATRAKFADAAINGDSDIDPNSFDGLSKMLKGSTTEFNADGSTLYADWTGTNMDDKLDALNTISLLDRVIRSMDKKPDAILGNSTSISLFSRIASLANFYASGTDEFGQTTDNYKGIRLIDLQQKDGDAVDVIPNGTRDVDSSQKVVTITGGPTGGSITLVVDGISVAGIAYNAVNADIATALNAAMDTAGNGVQIDSVTGGVFPSNAKTIKFRGYAQHTVTASSQLTGGTSPAVAITDSGTNSQSSGQYTDLYFVRFGLDGFHGASVAGNPLMQSWLPNFQTPGAVKTGEVEMGPVAVVLKKTRAAAVLRNVKVS